jgi:choline kinase
MRQNTRALILAAGRGQRLGALTANRPKCMTVLGGRALLDWQLAALRIVGLESIGLVRGYRADTFTHPDIVYFENTRWVDTNMVSSLLCAQEWLRQSPCLISYGDIVFRPEIARALLASEFDVAIAYDTLWRSLWELRFAHPEEDAESFRVANGVVAEIGRRPKSLESVQGQYLGLIKVTPAGWQRIGALVAGLDDVLLRRLDMTSLLQRLIDRGVAVGGVPIDGGWCELDNPQDLELYERKIAAVEDWSHDWRKEADGRFWHN